ncbi:MAG: ABC transporter ATP-binding protein [Planctomycetota bacterium]|nr:ABC transporter ATP-binding protein [Planctomycetota bacterium]MDI6786945.1 ABC transporter ATP-binding protein [Planctomycetota bacterium]
MIELKEVIKSFGSKIAVDRLSLTIPAGKLFAFIGSNGAGKTTTAKLISGLLQPTSGEIFIDGKNMRSDKQREELKQLISYIPDQPFLYEKLSGRELLYFIGRMYQVPQQRFNDSLEYYIELFRMKDYIDHLIEGYSLGMKQKVVIVAGLIHSPKIVVVDEPLVGLDPANVRIVKDLFRKIVREGATIFMSTHILAIAQEIADIIGVIHQGKLIAQGSFEELKSIKKQDTVSGLNLEDIFLLLCQDE